jgi:hypothetical protein
VHKKLETLVSVSISNRVKVVDVFVVSKVGNGRVKIPARQNDHHVGDQIVDIQQRFEIGIDGFVRV